MYRIIWTEKEPGKKIRKYKIEVKDLKQVMYILDSILLPMPNVKIHYEIYNPKGKIFKSGSY